MKCKIVQVGKRRDGAYRYWCLNHHANATAKYGVPAKQCVAANDLPIPPEACLDLDPRDFRGGIALWGSVPAVYDTSFRPMDRGIHVHARKTPGGSKKAIDLTYRKLRVPSLGDLLSDGWTEVDEIDAINFMVSRVFDFKTISVTCPKCGFAHLDRDWFSVHPHRRHQCHGCGLQFSDSVTGIGNPLSGLQTMLNLRQRKEIAAPRTLKIRQDEYPGGIQIWGSNPAIVWTSNADEEIGIHVHGFSSTSEEMPLLDDTYSKVVIDGIELNPKQVRYYMAQSAMPHLNGRVVSLVCPHCSKPHFDVGELAYTPHIDHECAYCHSVFRATTQMKKTIGNPFVQVRQRLASHAVNPLRTERLDLRPETI